jgi:hypothetical protein|tara:strand:+ start:380 stop:745 length:366 start_codon:yes stop_codon:yes gene_type:complete
MAVPNRPFLTSVNEQASLRQYVRNTIEIKIITLVGHYEIHIEPTKLLKDLPNEIKEQLNPDMDVKVFRPIPSGWEQIFDKSGNFIGTLEEQNINTITIEDYLKDDSASEFKLLVVWVPRQK